MMYTLNHIVFSQFRKTLPKIDNTLEERSMPPRTKVYIVQWNLVNTYTKGPSRFVILIRLYVLTDVICIENALKGNQKLYPLSDCTY